jgi:Fur family zinc uptake transcriptional regulator
MQPSAEAIQSNLHPLEHDHKKCVSEALGIAEHLCVVRGVQLTPIRHQVSNSVEKFPVKSVE